MGLVETEEGEADMCFGVEVIHSSLSELLGQGIQEDCPCPQTAGFFFNGMSLLASVYFKTARLCKINTGINT